MDVAVQVAVRVTGIRVPVWLPVGVPVRGAVCVPELDGKDIVCDCVGTLLVPLKEFEQEGS